MKTKLHPEVVKFLKQTATQVSTGSANYFYLPYWYKLGASGDTVEEFTYEHIPDELKQAINHHRNGTEQ